MRLLTVYSHNMVLMLRRIIFNLFGNKKQHLISEENKVVVPLDMVTEIMSYMPGKYILRYKPVCKSWRDMLSSLRELAQLLRVVLANCFSTIQSPLSALSTGTASSLFQLDGIVQWLVHSPKNRWTFLLY